MLDSTSYGVIYAMAVVILIRCKGNAISQITKKNHLFFSHPLLMKLKFVPFRHLFYSKV